MAEALTKKKIRYDWLDAIKALAMLLVIFGHLGLSMSKTYQAYASFIKLPLFFAASGFVFNLEKTKDVAAFVKSRIQRILLPYFYLCTLICIFNFAYERPPILEWLKTSAHNVFTGSIYMWFLPVIFLCNLMMLFVFKLFRNNDALILISAVVSLILGYVLLPDRHLFFDVNEALIAYPFCVFGYYFKTILMDINRVLLDIISVLSMLLFLALPQLYRYSTGHINYINMHENHYSSFFLDILIAFLGTIAVFGLMRRFKYPKFVIWFGQNTMFYYAFHIPACTALIWAAHKLLSQKEAFFKEERIYYIAFTVATIIVLAPACLFVNRYFPFLVGMQKKKKDNK